MTNMGKVSRYGNVVPLPHRSSCVFGIAAALILVGAVGAAFGWDVYRGTW